MRNVGGLTDAEVGRALGITRESANRLISRARRRVLALREQCAARSCLLGDTVGHAAP